MKVMIAVWRQNKGRLELLHISIQVGDRASNRLLMVSHGEEMSADVQYERVAQYEVT